MPRHVTYFQAPVVYTIPLQLLAYHAAILSGTDVDQPRNLAKSVTVESSKPKASRLLSCRRSDSADHDLRRRSTIHRAQRDATDLSSALPKLRFMQKSYDRRRYSIASYDEHLC